MNIAGYSFVGIDVPGFYGEPSDTLAIAFYQLAVWYPFFRAHNHHETPGREPWLYSLQVQKAIKEAVWLRYTFVHYLMGNFCLNHSEGEPILRPMWYQFPS